MSGYHSRLSPSGAHRYLRCTAAPDASDGIPGATSEYAAEGTMLHEVAERCLINGGLPYQYVGEIFEIDGFVFVFDKDHADCMIADLYDIRETFLNGVLYPETRVQLDYPLGPGESGTADIIGRTWRGVIHVEDWKFGEGIIVDAEWNEQGMLYAVGAIQAFFPESWDDRDQKVVIRIRQPRIMGAGSSWETTVGELRDWCEDLVKPKIAEIREGRGVFNPGPKQCHWCPRRRGHREKGIEPCAAYNQFNLDIAKQAFGEIEIASILGTEPERTPPKSLSPELRVWLLDHADMFKEWLGELADDARADLERGRFDQVPGKKLIAGRAGHRKFRDERRVSAYARSVTGEKAFETKLKSPAQLEKVHGEILFDLLYGGAYEQPAGKPVIVDLTNPKPALPPVTEALGPIPNESE